MKDCHIRFVGIITICIIQSAIAETTLLSKIQKKYAPGSTIKTEFTMKAWWSVREREEKKKGTVTITQGDKFRVSLGNDLYISDGEVYYQYSSASKQGQIKYLKDVDLSMHPSRILTTFLTQYPLTETKHSGRETFFNWTADSSSKASYMSVDVIADTKGTIKVLKLTDKNMNVFTYAFTKTKFGGTVPEGVFEFELPSDAQVIDER